MSADIVSEERRQGPRVVSCMLKPDIAIKGDGPDGERSTGLVWIYANNIGSIKAKDVRIETNIPSSQVESRLWIEADIVKDIKELPPERPRCIGVLGGTTTSAPGYWISFNYRGEDEARYSDRFELDLS